VTKREKAVAARPSELEKMKLRFWAASQTPKGRQSRVRTVIAKECVAKSGAFEKSVSNELYESLFSKGFFYGCSLETEARWYRLKKALVW